MSRKATAISREEGFPVEYLDERTEAVCLELGRLSYESSRRLLEAVPQLRNPEIVRQITEAVRTAVRVDVRRALTLAEAALAIARELQSDEAQALALRAKANALWFSGDCKAAVTLFEAAATLFEQAGQMKELGRTLSSSIQSLALLGEYRQAFVVAERAKEIFATLGESWRIARVDINVANIYHRQNRYREALAAYECAYQQLLPHRDMEGIGVALHNMAVCLMALDDFTGALATYRRVREFCGQHQMPLLVAQADYNIAFLYYLRGDYTRALDLLRTTAENCRENGDAYHLALCALDRSEIYLELNLVDEAAEMAQSSVEHFEQLGMGFELARSFINLAVAINAQGDSSRALELFGRAKEIALGENNEVLPHLIDLYRTIVLLDHQEIAKALELAASSANYFRSTPLPSKHALALLLLTRAYRELGQLNEAAQNCEEALGVLNRIDSPILLHQAHLLRGSIQECLGQTERAYESYKESRRTLEMLRSSLQRDELKLGFMRNRFEIYNRLLRICLQRGSDESVAEETLSHIEAAKSRTLRDLILGEVQPALLPEGSNIDKRVRELRKDLNWYYHRLEHEQFSQKTVALESWDTLKNQATKLERELVHLLSQAPASASVVATLRGASTATLDQIRSALGTDAALLEYFETDGSVYVAVVSAGTLKIVCLTSTPALSNRLRMLQFQLSKLRLGQNYVSRFHRSLLKAAQAHLCQLYRELIAPVEALLPVRDLIIVPFGPLHSLPFQALFDGQKYLLDKFVISYAPSASIFIYAHREMEVRTGRSLILGIDDAKTPFIREEVEAVAAVTPEPHVLFGPDATEQALRHYGRHSRLIHIASHGYFRHDNPMFSAVRLADSYLNLYDLYHLNLPVDLLTLSGCVTGMNVIAEGDELLGLTRGLLYAGARSLVLSLWDVDDRSTSEFMKHFYSHLQSSPRKADALRAAMLNLRERYVHPFYWAPFKLIGRALT